MPVPLPFPTITGVWEWRIARIGGEGEDRRHINNLYGPVQYSYDMAARYPPCAPYNRKYHSSNPKQSPKAHVYVCIKNEAGESWDINEANSLSFVYLYSKKSFPSSKNNQRAKCGAVGQDMVGCRVSWVGCNADCSGTCITARANTGLSFCALNLFREERPTHLPRRHFLLGVE